jgi:hypothetical protein
VCLRLDDGGTPKEKEEDWTKAEITLLDTAQFY